MRKVLLPFALGLLLARFSYTALVSATGLAVLLPLAFMAAIRFPVPKQAQGFPIARGLRLLREPFLVLLGLTLFLQSGMEISVGGWTATYFKEELGLGGHRGLFGTLLRFLGSIPGDPSREGSFRHAVLPLWRVLLMDLRQSFPRKLARQAD